MVVWLVRHGATEWNEQGRYQGWTDIPLSRKGRRQVRSLRRRIGRPTFDGVWSSDLSRTVQTATILGSTPTTDVRLRELNFGALEGRSWDQLDVGVQEALLEFNRFAAPDGESMPDLRRRVTSFLDDLVPGRHLVVSHAGVIRIVLAACGLDVLPRHCHVSEVDWSMKTVLGVD